MINSNKKTLIICPPSMKQTAIEIESNSNSFNNVKIMSTNEVKENFFFSTNIETIIAICKKENCSFSYAKNIINLLYYIDETQDYSKHYEDIYFNKENDSNYTKLKNQILLKVNELKTLKIELKNKGLLIENNLFKNIINSFNIRFDYFTCMNSEDKWLYKKIMNKDYEEKELNNLHLDYIYEFTTLNDECIYILDNIASLINDKTDINKIVILNPTPGSIYTLDRISKQYNIDLDLPKKIKLGYTQMAKEFIFNLDNSDIESALNKINDKYLDPNNDFDIGKNSKIYNAILDIVNKYAVFTDINEYKDYIIEEIKNSNISVSRLSNAIKVCDLSSYQPNNEDIVFIMNANDGVINTAYKNNDILSDVQKKLIGMPTSVDKNEDDKEYIKQKILKMNNFTITYHLNSGFEHESPSFLNDCVKKIEKDNKMVPNAIVNPRFDSPYSFSKQKDIYALINKRDTKNYDDEYTLLNNKLGSSISSYSSSFKIDNKDKAQDYIYNHFYYDKNGNKNKNGLLLSYTKMDEFYKCPFSFYLKNVLAIDDFESTFSLAIGNIFHDVLRNIYNKDFNLDNYFNAAVANQKFEFTAKEVLLLEKLKKELEYAILLIKDHNDKSSFNSVEFEKEVVIDLETIKDLKIKFKGTIDKIMSYVDDSSEDKKKYISIIDYKTGDAEIDSHAMNHGVGLQLPTYLLLAQTIYPKCDFAGFYLQRVLHEEAKQEKNKTRNDLRKTESKLNGYTTENEKIISKLDHTYQNSEFIKGLKFTKGDKKEPPRPVATAKLFNQNKVDELITLVKEKIKNSYSMILDGNFEISPYIDNSGKYKGCEYCKFADVCYKYLATEVEKNGN